VLGEEPPSKYERYRQAVVNGLRAADAVVAPTRAMLQSLREHYHAPLRGRLIPNGARIERFSTARKEPFVLAAGRLWDEAKTLGALAAVAPHLRWPVVLAGSAPQPDGGARRHEGVKMLGWLDQAQLRALMARASIYALPARYEPFGLSVLEAALSGCALVLGDIPTLRELWRDNALFVRPDDSQALANAIEQLARDDGLRCAMSVAAQGRALFFTAEQMGRRYLDLYRELVSRRSAGASPSPRGERSWEDEGGMTVRP
jgi:glycosyltransferase involved in cell wall biosynthesis